MEEREAQFGYGRYRLLVVTDGEANDDDVMERNIREILSRGLTVDVIGVDMKGNHTLATKVHSYRRADDPQALEQALGEVFAEVSGSGDNAAQDEDFALLEGIPVEIAAAMVEALSKPTDNSPIGTRPLKQAANGVVPRAQPDNRQPVPPPVPAQQSKGGGCHVSTGMVIMVIVALALVRGSKRR